jgi:hypothetical protein
VRGDVVVDPGEVVRMVRSKGRLTSRSSRSKISKRLLDNGVATTTVGYARIFR